MDYLDNFIKCYAAIAAPLYQLTRKAAALLQKTDKGTQLVHFISRAMTETEKRYSQTEKDALAIKLDKERL